MHTLVQHHFTAKISKENIDEENHRVKDVMVSTGHPGASEEIASPRGWQLGRINANPVFFYNHQTHSDDPANLIGTITEITKTPEGLKATLQYDVGIGNAKADLVWAQVLRGTVRGYSVGFMPKAMTFAWDSEEELAELEDWERAALKEGAAYVVFTEQELFEVSQVGVPDKPDTVLNSVEERQLRINKLKEIRTHMDAKDKETAPQEQSETPPGLIAWMAAIDSATEALTELTDAIHAKVASLAPPPAPELVEKSVEEMTETELMNFLESLPQDELDAAAERLLAN